MKNPLRFDNILKVAELVITLILIIRHNNDDEEEL